MINLPIWLFVVLIATNVFTLMLVFSIIYFIAGLHDLKTADKVADNKCPYEIEK